MVHFHYASNQAIELNSSHTHARGRMYAIGVCAVVVVFGGGGERLLEHQLTNYLNPNAQQNAHATGLG